MNMVGRLCRSVFTFLLVALLPVSDNRPDARRWAALEQHGNVAVDCISLCEDVARMHAQCVGEIYLPT
jgi:hypothetical protein